jgi:hypothetical protein
MDLSQAEAVADIIHSKTSDFAKVSVKNLSGILKNKIDEIRNEIFEVLSKITAGIDFPEDVKEPEYDYLIDKFNNIINSIDMVLSGAKTSNIFRQGASVAIVGKPNVGKSSLFNALLIASPKIGATDNCLSLGQSLVKGILSVNTISSRAESITFCVADPDITQCEATALTVEAPDSLIRLAAFTIVPAVSTISSINTTSLPTQSPIICIDATSFGFSLCLLQRINGTFSTFE